MPNEILFEDILNLNKRSDYNRIKVRFIQHNGTDDPMELYKSEPDIINQ